MAQAKDVVLFPQTAVSGAGTVAGTTIIGLPEQFTSAIVVLNVTAQSGTTPTMNFYIQEQLPIAAAADTVEQINPTGTAVYDDLISFTQVTTATGQWVARIVGGGNAINPISDGALAAASARSGPLGKKWRIKYTLGGTLPAYTVSCTARFIP